MTIQQYLSTHRLLTDGAFGTYYAARYATDEAPETANLTAPERVREIHAEYLEAGARLIRTNTFAANTVSLGTDAALVREHIKSACRLAAQALQAADAENVYIAGDIGPIPPDGEREPQQQTDEYLMIARTFLEEGVHILTFETFAELSSILPVLRTIKQEAPDTYIMVQLCVNQFGYSAAGLSARSLLAEAQHCPEIDAAGLNCGVGPTHMQQILADLPTDKPCIALPNAGYPQRARGVLRYSNNAEYFAAKVSELAQTCDIAILGGCCGTTPDYIRRMVKRGLEATNQPDLKAKRHSVIVSDHIGAAPTRRRGFLYTPDGTPKTHKLIAVELAPPVSADDEKLLSAAHFLKNCSVDVLTFPDSPSGRTRVDSVLMAEKVRRETGMEVMPHICCRDKNAIAMRSLFLGAHINDISNFLIITGDPVPSMARGTTKAVFNFDSVGLMRIAADMNADEFAARPLSYGGAISQGRRNLDVETQRVIKKMEAGAEFFLTQPIFTEESAQRVRMIKERTGARILCGIMPLISRKNALFMKNEIAGVDVPDEVIARYPENADREEGEAVGVALAADVIAYTQDFADGYYFSFPFNRVTILQKIEKN